MPLKNSAKDSAIGPNIKREMGHGKPYRQALAIALSVQDRARRRRKRKRGEGVAKSFSEVMKAVDADAAASPVAKSFGECFGEGFKIEVRKAAAVPEQRLVYGWASVISKGGETVFDLEGDAITPATLEKAAHDYLSRSRVGKHQHRGAPVMELVESVVLTKSKQKAMGIDLGHEGWWTGFRVNDAAVWEKVKAGDLPALSIHGAAVRQPVKD